MATPALKQQQANVTLFYNSPGSMRFDTFLPDGTVLDVSSGYTLADLGMVSAVIPNSGFTLPGLLSHITATFDTTGVTISWTDTASIAISNSVPVQTMIGAVKITNDGGTTRSMLGKFNLTADQSSVLI